MLEKALKALNNGSKVLARKSNVILLATEESSQALASNVLTTKTLRLQTGYMGTMKTWITLHYWAEVPKKVPGGEEGSKGGNSAFLVGCPWKMCYEAEAAATAAKTATTKTEAEVT